MKPTFGAADYADEGCLMANNEVELVEQMEKAMAMPLPGPAAFEELSSESIGNRLNELYESLN
jgi:hypothetical protein